MTEIRYINNAGGGFNGKRTVDDGTTIEAFFAAAMPGETRDRYNIRINNAVPTQGQILRGGDLVSIIPGKYDGGAFGGDFIANLRAAAQLGAVVRETPDLIGQLQAVNELGTAIKGIPGLAENIGAVVQFVRAVKVLDEEPTSQGAPAGVETGQSPAYTFPPEVQRLLAVANAGDLCDLLAQHGGIINLRAKLQRAEQHEQTAAAPAMAELIGRTFQPGDIDTTPTKSGCVKLVTGYGIGRDEPIKTGETIEQFFARIKPGASPEAYLILVNGSTADADLPLKEGFSVVIRDLKTVEKRVAQGASW
jgi:hypothetical protein